MKSNCITGFALHLYPSIISSGAKLDLVQMDTIFNDEKLDNTIIAFSSEMPTGDTLNSIVGATSFMDLFTGESPVLDEDDVVVTINGAHVDAPSTNNVLDANETQNLDFTFEFDQKSNTRTIKKSTVDAWTLTTNNKSQIVWAAILFKASSGSSDYVVITDSVGSWSDPDCAILFDNVTPVEKTGETTKGSIIFKDFSINVTDQTNSNF
jgi:hypothetical protein